MGELNINEFIDGQRDCKEGVPHKPGMGESYDTGYGVQYELEQIHNEMTNEHRRSAKAPSN